MQDDPKTYTPRPPGRIYYPGWIVVAIVVLALTAGMVLARGVRLNRQSADLAAQADLGPHVLVAPVVRAARSRVVTLPGTVHGFIETPVYAKIPGYLKEIYVDKGDRVVKGQLIARLDSPEIDNQVANARASYDLALITDRRNQALLRERVIAAQTADEARGAMRAARATLDQYSAMQQYKEIRAPFAGMVTARYVDPGQLIPQVTTPSGSATPNMPVIALATLAKLRVYADVPQSAAPFIRDGDAAAVTVTEFPDRRFVGTVTRHPRALTSATRTMLAEVDLNNPDGSLYPGMYATIAFTVAMPPGVPMVPDDALIFLDGQPYVPVVRADRLKLAAVTLGYDDGVNVQIRHGIASDDLVALNVGQAARDGEPVRPITAPPAQP
ncbi:MAG: efflux RND transporter periplasmic adaptor subunit [Candidatus Binataceae bacterium]|nr:efflux RND transporter periplasmic adaptor subunit [Candidatus Binataceae bacterium]